MSRNASNIVYMGSLPNEWTLDNLKSVVCGSGRIVEVRCLMETPTKNKGYGFVEYATPEEATHGQSLLSLIRLIGTNKKIRVELSKEGLRTDGILSKPVMNLNRNFLPSNVVLPDEMIQNGPAIPSYNAQQMQQQQQQVQSVGQFGNVLDQLPAEFVQLMTTNQQFQQIVTQMLNNGVELQQILEATKPYLASAVNGGINATQSHVTPAPMGGMGQSTGGYAQMQQGQGQLPDFLKNASTYLPALPADLFTSQDNIDESLKKFEPPLLIQLITNLKEVVDTANTYNAAAVIKEAPDLAVASAQALLLMGFIDADVIQEAMAQVQQTSQPEAASAVAATSGNSNTPVPPPPTMQQQQSQPIATDPSWQGLQQSSIEKLSKLDRSQANMIAQVLKMSPQQVYALPPDQRSMVEQLRTQYL